jgi:hypothetical protein
MPRQMITFANDKVVESIPVTDFEYKKVADLLSNRPLFEVMHELEVNLVKRKNEVKSQLDNLEARVMGPVQEAEKKINQLRYDLNQADLDLREAANKGKYSAAPTIEARKVEITQSILHAELELAAANFGAAGERARFLEGIAGGQAGSGASIDGLEWNVLANIARAIIYAWSNDQMKTTVPGMVYQQALEAGDQAKTARAQMKEAKKALDDYRAAAQARYSGAGVSKAASDIKQAQPPVSSNPALRNGTPNWGEVG